jgi:hypothetical protein
MGIFNYEALGLVNLQNALVKTVDVNSDIDSAVDATGQSATANAFADVFGSANAITETDTFAQVDAVNLITQSGSSSLAAATGTAPPPPVVEQLNLALIMDATGSTDEQWVLPMGGDVSFGPFDDDQNDFPDDPDLPDNPVEGNIGAGPGPGDVIDAEIAAYKNLLLDLAGRVRDAEAADDNLEIEANIFIVKHYIDDETSSTTLNLDFIEGDTTDAEIEAGLADTFAFLENTGSNGTTNYNEAIQEATDWFAGVPDNPDDANGPDNLLFQLTDEDPFQLTPTSQESIDALDAVPTLQRHVWLVPDANIQDNPDARLEDIDNTPGSPGTLDMLSDVTDLVVPDLGYA